MTGVQTCALPICTIILNNAHGNLLAVKVQKAHENYYELCKEYGAAKFLNMHAAEWKIQSALPKPSLIATANHIDAWLKPLVEEDVFNQFMTMIGDRDLRDVYVYEIDHAHRHYFTYLHDVTLSDEEFRLANRRCVHDLFTLLTHGIAFPQLADLFHNLEHTADRVDGGRFQVLANLLHGWKGSGRLTGWKVAVEYPNVRGSGLADLGDYVSINDFIGYTETIRKYYSDVWDKHHDTTANYVLANLMGEYQYVLFLIAGRRGSELAEQANNQQLSADAIKQIWQTLASQIFDNCVYAVSLVTKQSEADIRRALLVFVDLDRMARQMQFWMTHEYVPYIKKNKMPTEIYGEDVNITIDINLFRKGTFHPKLGCAIDGVHQDLGAVNGQEPLKETNKLLYWMVNLIFIHYHNIRLSLQDIKKITSADTIIAAETLRKNSFFHLPEKSYHAIQAELCEERLKQPSGLSRHKMAAISKEAKTHKEKWAAATIFEFWRKNRPHNTVQTNHDAMQIALK